MSGFSKNVALLALGFWLGCAVWFTVAVAPTLTNPAVASGLSHSMADAISGAILRRIYLATYIGVGIAAFFLLIASFGEGKGAWGPRRALILCLLALGLNAMNDVLIHDWINKVKVEMANPKGNEMETLHRKLNQWHKASTWIYYGTMACGGLAAILLLPSGGRGKSRGSS